MPTIIFEMMRVGSMRGLSEKAEREITVIKEAPIATKALVLKPADLWDLSLSKPIAAPRAVASKILKNVSENSSIVMFKLFKHYYYLLLKSYFQDVINISDKNKFKSFSYLGRNVFQVLFVFFRQNNNFQTGSVRRQNFFFNSPYFQNLASQSYFSRHSDILANRFLGKHGNNRCNHGYASGRPIFGNSS